MRIEEYLTREGKSPFEVWFLKLDARAAAKVTTALARLEGGNTSNVKSLGSGVHEYKIDFGPGYRIYFGYDGKTLVILLAGGTKKRQQTDIDAAKDRWQDYKQRKKEPKGG
ncbi:MAG: type II toxin-antitoxin system RelE/ParE family toxin [Desulfuromonadales bacterium]|nr:type II toxin-antitoxin system RelE/ParE family toxin [Desulfuromonadales bacterium]